MKRTVSILLTVVLFAAALIGCGEKKAERVLFNEADLSKIVELGEYKDIPVDTSSDTFKSILDDVYEADVTDNEFYTTENLTEGEVQNGDVANIDYSGKKDGVAFEGGTDQGYDLEIGSGSFIEGFEDGLIGVAIGETVDLNLTFPENYDSEDLAGQDVVFTVKVNSVQRQINQKPEEYYSKLSFKSVSEYNKDARKRAVENYLVQTVVANSEIKEYPEADIDIIYNTTKNAIEMSLEEQYEMDYASYLSAIGQTEAEYKESLIENQIKPSMDVQMVIYAILDKEGIEFTKDEVEAEIDKIVKSVNSSDVTADVVKSIYGDYYFEEMVATEKVMDFLYKNAKLN